MSVRSSEKFFPRAGLSSPTRVAVALGSNLGDRHAHLELARRRLAQLLTNLQMSSVIETDPVDVPDIQRSFLNAAAVGDTTLGVRDFFHALQDIEQAAGRTRPYPRAARTLDLDLILFGTTILREPRLEIPHPRFRERRFVLSPLAEIAPDLRDPVTSLTVSELLARLPPGH
jgi:2-amino-4-hydroxy-6-hydroxymethyldihydropteridine diphosphokinase